MDEQIRSGKYKSRSHLIESILAQYKATASNSAT
jgi:Arc/MetJ-type ribon-helix-helix transcriptional regulator